MRNEGEATLRDRVVFVPRGESNGVRLCTGTVVAVTGFEDIPKLANRQLRRQWVFVAPDRGGDILAFKGRFIWRHF